MINREQPILLLQRRTLLAVTSISAAAWITLPVVALVIFVTACLAYALIQTLYIVVLVIACVAIVLGGLAAVVGIFAVNESPGVFFGGVVAAVIGYGLSQLAPSLNVGDKAFAAIVVPAQVVIKWFIQHDWCVWAWTPVAVASIAALSLRGAIGLARHLPELRRRLKRRFHDCPTCHHRGRPTHACSTCGAAEHDLRASAYGVLFARCDSCGTRLPTLDLLGRRRLKRSCGHCGVALTHEDLGRLPVWHVAMAFCDREMSPHTTLCVIAGRLVYLHESGTGQISETRAAASLGYLNILDQLIICGDGESLKHTRPLLAGILGVLERGLGADVRHRTGLPACIVERAIDGGPLMPCQRDSATASWAPAMRMMFSRVSAWRGELNSRSLGTLIEVYGLNSASCGREDGPRGSA